MKTKLVAIFLLALIISQIVLPTFAVLADEIEESNIIIETLDENLKQYLIKQGYDTNEDENISIGEMRKLSAIYYNENAAISTFAGLEYATNLQSLQIYTYETTDYMDVEDLVSHIKETSIYDLTLVGKFNNIEKVYELKSLTRLYLSLYSDNGIAEIDVANIGNLVNLEQLDIQGKLKNIVAIKNLEKLSRLWLDSTSESDITCDELMEAIENFPKDVDVSIYGNYIYDLGDLPINKYVDVDFSEINMINAIMNDSNSCIYNPDIILESYYYDIDSEGKKISLYVEDYENSINPINVNYASESEYKQSFNGQLLLKWNATVPEEEYEIIEFKNQSFKQSLINNGYDLNGDNEISKYEIGRVTDTYYNYDYNQNDFIDLKYAINLKSLSINFMNRTDIDLYILKSFKRLITLSLQNLQEIPDLTPLESLTELKSLYLYSNQYRDFDFNSIKELDNIENLELSKVNQLKNINVLKGKNLNSFGITCNDINTVLLLKQIDNMNNLNLSIELADTSDEKIKQTIKQLEELNCNRLALNFYKTKNSYGVDYNYNLGVIKPNSTVEIPYKDLGPIFSYLLDEKSKYYDKDLYVSAWHNYSNQTKVTVDNDNQKIIIQTGNEEVQEQQNIYISNYKFSSNMRVNITVSEDEEANIEINIPDNQLKEQLMWRIDKNNDGIITKIEIEKLQSVQAYSVKDLTGLEYAINLTDLYVSGEVSDISPIQNLNKLTNLELYNCKIDDLSNFKKLQNLKELALHRNNVDDLSPILNFESISTIEKIEIEDNKIKNLDNVEAILKQANNLKNFTLRGNPLENITDYKKLKDAYPQFKIESINFYINLGEIEKGTQYKFKLPQSYYQFREYVSEENINQYLYDCKIVGNDLITNTPNVNMSYASLHEYRKDAEEDIEDLEKYSVEIEYSGVVSGGDTSNEITFKDPVFNDLIKENYDIDGDGKITEHDLLNISEIFNWSDKGEYHDIKNLEGIEKFENLTWLELDRTNISDLKPIANILKRCRVSLYSAKISDLSPLKNIKLEEGESLNLELINNFIDLSNNSENVKILKDLGEKDYSIALMASVQKKGDPEHFEDEVVFGDSRIKEKLIELGADLNNDNILTRRELWNVTNTRYHDEQTEVTIEELDLSGMNITDISGLEYLTNLKKLNLSDNQIEDILPLANLFNLDYLNLNNNKIKDISMLPYYVQGPYYFMGEKGYKEIHLANNQISDISCMKNWYYLQSTIVGEYRSGGFDYDERRVKIDLSNNNISDISGVKDFKTIKELNLSNNKITNISEIRDYNFEINTRLESDEDENYRELLNEFDGIDLSGNQIDLENEVTVAAKEIFDSKGVTLNLANQQTGDTTKKGDINTDGKLTLYDAFTILRKVIMMASEDELTEEEKYIMDYNGDKKVTLYDAFSFLRQVILTN